MCHTIPGVNELDLMHADGTGLIHLPLECRGGPRSPQWSPDGTRILSGYPDLYTVDPNGQSFVQLTFDGTNNGYDEVQWSRQGTKILYTRYTLNRGEYDMALFTMSAKGLSKQRLSPLGMEVHSPSWGP
jgi:Tol biopolymer transport system component